MAINQWDKGSKENGPNAHKKGNRTPGQPRNGVGLAEISRRESAEIAKYREIAEKQRKAKKYKQEDLAGIVKRLNSYITEQTEQEKPLTVAGMIRAAGVSKSAWYEMIGGEYDYRLYQYAEYHNIDIDAVPHTGDIPTLTDSDGEEILLITYREALQKAMLAIEEQTEERLYSKGRVGDIFSLKAVHGWQEDSQPQSVTNNLVIASPEQAKRAIDLLK
nr:MAG TPA: hypothetical protein [Caudoviricetes sp.]